MPEPGNSAQSGLRSEPGKQDTGPQQLAVSLDWVVSAAGYMQRSDLPAELQQSTRPLTKAAVLIPLYWFEDQWQVLFIRRVKNARDRHSGQVAFPGGKCDPQDQDATATALREAHEEVGLEPAEVKVIHTLEDYRTSSNFIVTPVVGVVPWPYPYRAQLTEVDRIFSFPLNWLANQSNVQLKKRELSDGSVSDTLKVVYYDQFDGELLWGASARMTLALLNALRTGDLELEPREP